MGVFVNLPPEQVRAIMEYAHLDLAQLSGDEPPSDLEMIGRRVAFKVLRSNGSLHLSQIAEEYPRRLSPPELLVDAAVPGEYGGTGRMADWQAAPC